MNDIARALQSWRDRLPDVEQMSFQTGPEDKYEDTTEKLFDGRLERKTATEGAAVTCWAYKCVHFS